MSRQDVENGEKLWTEAFNSGDAAGVAACYTTQGRLLPPNDQIVSGRPALTEYVQGFLDMQPKISFDVIDVHEAPHLCVAVGTYEMTFPKGGPGPDHDSGKFIEVWAQQPDGSWLITDDCFNSSLPVPTG